MKRMMILGTMLMLIMSCNDKKPGITASKESVRIPVRVVKSEIKNYIPSIELSGTAFAGQEANLGAALPGRVEKIYFPEGSRVKKGDLLVSMSAELYTEALVEYNTIEKDFERVSRLNEKGSISVQDYDHVKAKYEASKAKTEMMKKNTEITAPFSGTITEYLVQPGENYFFNINLDPGYSRTSGILRLMKLDPLQVEVEVNERQIGKLKKGRRVVLQFDAVEDTVFTGTISSVKPVLSTLTHSATVKVEIRNNAGMISPGMFAHVKFELDQVSSVAVPQSAVVTEPGTAEEYLFTADNGVARRHNVERLWTDGVWVGVKGVGPDEDVVTSGKEKLLEGSQVEIR